MPGLKKTFTDFRADHTGETVNNKVAQPEIDRYYEIVYFYPSDSATYIGTAAAGTSGQSKAFVVTNRLMDYPRTPLFTTNNSSGSAAAGTCTITGVDQFGNTVTESIAFDGSEVTTAAGTKIYRTITAGTVTFGTATKEASTATLGVAVGTTAGVEARFGLGVKIGTTSDVKMITWIDNGTGKELSDGTIVESLVSATSHSFAGTHDVAKTDIYKVQILPTYNTAKQTAFSYK